jgi:hypothetical protein
MSWDLDGFAEEGQPKRRATLESLRGISLGAKLVLAGGALLFFSLFLTWQNLEVDYGRTGTGTQLLDGWDVFGLVIGMLTVAIVSLVIIVKLSDVDTSPDVAWELITLVLSAAVLGLVLAKNLTDRDSAWPSYLGLALALAVVAGAFLDWSSERFARNAVPGRRRRRIRPVA